MWELYHNPAKYEFYQRKMKRDTIPGEVLNQVGGAVLNYFWPGVGTAAASLMQSLIDFGKTTFMNRLEIAQQRAANIFNLPKNQVKRMKQAGINPYFWSGVDNRPYETAQLQSYDSDFDPSTTFQRIASGVSSLASASYRQHAEGLIDPKIDLMMQQYDMNEYQYANVMPELALRIKYQNLGLRLDNFAKGIQNRELLNDYNWLQQKDANGVTNQQYLNELKRDTKRFSFNLQKLAFYNFAKLHSPNSGWEYEFDGNDVVLHEGGDTPYTATTLTQWMLNLQATKAGIDLSYSQTLLNQANKGLVDYKSVYQSIANASYAYDWWVYTKTGYWPSQATDFQKGMLGDQGWIGNKGQIGWWSMGIGQLSNIFQMGASQFMKSSLGPKGFMFSNYPF